MPTVKQRNFCISETNSQDVEVRDEKINVLHIIAELPLGGAENLLLTLAKNIDRDNFNLIICCLNKEGYIAERIKGECFKVICLGGSRFRYVYKKIFWLMKLLKDEKIDIVHTHLYQADFWGRLISFLLRVPIICRTEHGVINSIKNKPFFYKMMEYTGINKFFDNISDAVVYISESQKNEFNKSGRKTNKAFMNYNAIDEKYFSVDKSKEYIRACNRFSSSDILIGIISRLAVQKGHKYLFKAMESICEKYSNVKLLVIGSGNKENNLRELACELNLERNILFLLTREDVPELMKAIDIAVQPSLFEPFGMTIVEAMYSGLPVVATNIGGIPEILKDGETGVLVPPKDSDAIKNALLKLIESPEIAKKMGEKGRETALLRFCGQRYAREMERIYVSLFERSKKAALEKLK